MKNTQFSLLALLAFSGPALADIQYTTVTSMDQGEGFAPMSTTTTWVKKGLQRDDTEQKIGTFTRSESSITNIARRELIALDPALKIYTVNVLGGTADGAGGGQGDIKTTAVKPSPKGKGKMVMTLGAQFLGIEKMLNYDARHYKTSAQTDASGCAGDGRTAIKTEQWMVDLELPALDYNSLYKGGFGGGDGGSSDCEITFERKGDVAGYDAANKGLALKRITFDDKGKAIMQQQITMISLAALTDERFAAPAEFKKVSREEYDKTRQDAMMAAFTRPAKNGKPAQRNTEKPVAEKPAPTEDAPEEAPEQTPEAPAETDNVAETVAKEAAKQKVKKKLRLPF